MNPPIEPVDRPNRRNFLKIIGGGTIAAATGAGIFLATRTPSKALEPWRLAEEQGSVIDPRETILAHAILAPNPHNRQPWEVDLAKPGEMMLYCDLDRRLPETDPFDRQITIGLGCFLELASLTALQIGYALEIETFPQGEGSPRLDQRPVARMVLKETAATPDPLFGQIFDRRSNKELFDMTRQVDGKDAAAIVSAAKGHAMAGEVLSVEKISQLIPITEAAMINELETYRTLKESVDLMRIGKAEIEANPDGIDLGGAFFDTLYALGLVSREDMLTMSAFQMEQARDSVLPQIRSAMGYVWVKTDGNSRRNQIEAGRAYVRMNLKATELGIAMHPLSQALQEYAEVAEQNAQLRNTLGVADDETLQMFARIGYGENQPPSPRWPYETRMRRS